MLITPATEQAFAGAVTAVHDNFDRMNGEASTGAQQLSETIANALAEVGRLNRIEIKTNYNPFDDEAKVKVSGQPGDYTVKYGGKIYENIIASSQTGAVKALEKNAWY